MSPGRFKAKEDRSAPREVYNERLYVTAVVIAWAALTFGYDSAFIATTLIRPSFLHAFGLDRMSPTEKAGAISNLTSVFQAGAFFGSLGSCLVMERFGRKITLHASSVVFVIGAILMTATSHSLGKIYAGRTLTGIGCGGITSVVPTMPAEISPPAIRGRLTGFFEIAYQIGSVAGFWINYGITRTIPNTTTSTAAWRIPMAVQLVPGGILMFGCFLLKESPQYLVKARREDIREELEMIHARLDEERSVARTTDMNLRSYVMGAAREVSQPSVRSRMILVFVMFAFQNFSGAAAINYYSPTLFASIGVAGIDATLYTGLYGLIKAASSIAFYLFAADAWGRRQPWIVSNIGCAACMLYLGVYVFIGHPSTEPTENSPSTAAGARVAVSAIMMFSFFWSFGMNGLPWVISAEMFAVRLRSLTGAWAAMCQWLWNYIITKSTPYIVVAVGGAGTWFFFVGCLSASTAFAVFCLRETRGTPIEDMDRLFERPFVFLSRADSSPVSGRLRVGGPRESRRGNDELQAQDARKPEESTVSVCHDGVSARV